MSILGVGFLMTVEKEIQLLPLITDGLFILANCRLHGKYKFKCVLGHVSKGEPIVRRRRASPIILLL